LTPDGAEYLSKLVSEVLGNAEEHSGHSYWWVCAYLRMAQPERRFGDCHITMFCFGKTLAQSLQELPEGSLLRGRVSRLVERHRRKGLFGRGWEPDDLWTLYALQEGVSRYNVGVEKVGDRGNGTADMIEFFQQLGQSVEGSARPIMCVLSGRTHMVFDGRYRIEVQEAESGEKRRIIALNEQNDLEIPPDPSCVKRLARRFPGTMISLNFFVDPRYLDGHAEN
jgi:hypothetical protein